jgi:murE/murF fusion protein
MLLKNLISISNKKFRSIEIKTLALDSRKVKNGSLFFAIDGDKFNGKDFIKDAINNGAAAVICSSGVKIENKNFPIIKVKNCKKALSTACKFFFKNKPKNIIAVTGTNGKSSVADFFYQILSINKIPVASIGTLGIKKNDKLKKTKLTSLDIISLHEELTNLKKNEIENVIIEASSHGLSQGRLDGLNFKAGIFTNFSQDHLDYHKTMKNYFNSKSILFSTLLKKNKYMITDSNIREFKELKKIAKKRKLKIITLNNNPISINQEKFSLQGDFQNINLSMSILAAKVCGLNKEIIRSSIKKIKSVNGRLQQIKILPNKAKVIIDYAHTPEALRAALKTLRDNFKENITLVFGCGGERDFKKRSIMAKIANKFCDKIYVTDDNPRYENPKKIRKEIAKYLTKKKCLEIGNRTMAIKHAIKNSKPFEIILIAGKGHETTQDYGNKIFHISDKKIILNTKIAKKNFNINQLKYNFNTKILNKVLQNTNNYKFIGTSINSKENIKKNLFIAIKGKKHDGHNFVEKALKKEANYCAVSKKLNISAHKKIIKVNNTFNFLNKLAVEKRKATKATIIAVTGSCGKTSLKTLLGTLLNKYNNTFFSPKSYNNHYGVPISLSNLEANHKFGVFEIGMSKSGEIKKLSQLVKPDLAIITNIAESHIENFKNIHGIAKAKAEIIDNIKKGGIIILNKDDKFFNYLSAKAKKNNLKIISFGMSKKSDVYPIHIKNFKNETAVKIKVIDQVLNLNFKYVNIFNILSSLAVLRILNLDIKKISKNFKFVKSLSGRGKIHKISRFKAKFKLIDESYNANPLSMKNAIISLSKLKKNHFNKYLLLSDMLELGNKSDFYHKNLSKIINNTDIDKVFVCGKKILNTYKYIKKKKQGNILQNLNDFDEIFSEILKNDDYLMIKGSNAMGLNKLTANIIRETKNVI